MAAESLEAQLLARGVAHDDVRILQLRLAGRGFTSLDTLVLINEDVLSAAGIESPLHRAAIFAIKHALSAIRSSAPSHAPVRRRRSESDDSASRKRAVAPATHPRASPVDDVISKERRGRTCTSKYPGVSLDKVTRKWKVQRQAGGRPTYFAQFANEADAGRASLLVADKLAEGLPVAAIKRLIRERRQSDHDDVAARVG